MLDIKLIREHPEIVKKDLKKRDDAQRLKLLDEVIKLDKEYLELLRDVEELRAKRNKLAREIGEKKKKKEDAAQLLKEAGKIPKNLEDIETQQGAIQTKLTHGLMRLPNILHESVPVGKDDSENVEIRKWGKPKKQGFELKSHGELFESLGIAEFERAAKISGNGFFFLKGALVQLNRGLIQLALNHLAKKGFTLIEPPLMMHRAPYEGVTDLGDFEKVMYSVGDDEHFLIATSEHPIAAMHMDEILDPASLPIKYAGYSPCFRREIGSSGVDTKGLFRTHQFYKVEQFVFCKPEDSWSIHEELIKNAEELFQMLELPYRIVAICTGDIGTVAAKKYDLEVWMPRQQKYREAISCSNCTDYQARRLKIRMGIVGAGEKQLVHTLNSTAIATSRMLVAIAEHYQQKDGSLLVPKALRPFVGIDVIRPKK